eukprot:scaffold225379_cov17-Tisochrysis_lutea.AAC.1
MLPFTQAELRASIARQNEVRASLGRGGGGGGTPGSASRNARQPGTAGAGAASPSGRGTPGQLNSHPLNLQPRAPGQVGRHGVWPSVGGCVRGLGQEEKGVGAGCGLPPDLALCHAQIDGSQGSAVSTLTRSFSMSCPPPKRFCLTIHCPGHHLKPPYSSHAHALGVVFLQVERAQSSKIGGGAPANGYAARFAKAPSARAPGAQQSPGPRTPASALPASQQTKEAAASSSSPTPKASPSPDLPTPNKLSPYLSAAEDAKAMRAAAHDQGADDDMKSAHSGMEHEEEPQPPLPALSQQQREQQKEEQKSAGHTESNGHGSPMVQQQQQQQQEVEVKLREESLPQQHGVEEEPQGQGTPQPRAPQPPQTQQPQSQHQHQQEGKQAEQRGPSAVSSP